VHMWVEGFFEVFSTILIAYLFLKLGLLNIKIATTSALMAASIYMLGGIIGMLHHLYFSGTPIVITAFGGIFSALEVVPLALIGFEAHHNYSLSKAQPWVKSYKWPIYFFIAVCFWNLVGAGLFGFLINMPISLYYLQGLNTTPLHSHGALFGVYGNLSIGLILFCLRGLTVDKVWNNIILACAFWFLNLGLAAMCFLSLLPIGLIQAWSSIANDMWYARSAEFTHSSLIHDLIWVRTIGDVLFTLGALALIWFIFQIGFAKQKLTN
jgi:nitric oxide reductase subunit B